MFAEVIFALELLALAAGFCTFVLSLIQVNGVRTVGIVISWFIIIMSLALMMTTAYFTRQYGRDNKPKQQIHNEQMMSQEEIQRMAQDQAQAIHQAGQVEQQRIMQLSQQEQSRILQSGAESQRKIQINLRENQPAQNASGSQGNEQQNQ